VITAEKSDGAFARMTLNLRVIQVEDVKDFCWKFLCFYDAVTYHAIEDFNENFKPHDIGELSPKIYGRLCKMFELNYELLNGELNANYRKASFIVLFPSIKARSLSPSKIISSLPVHH
jgi:hypothetical protein